jgi:hypothetical protein
MERQIPITAGPQATVTAAWIENHALERYRNASKILIPPARRVCGTSPNRLSLAGESFIMVVDHWIEHVISVPPLGMYS